MRVLDLIIALEAFPAGSTVLVGVLGRDVSEVCDIIDVDLNGSAVQLSVESDLLAVEKSSAKPKAKAKPKRKAK